MERHLTGDVGDRFSGHTSDKSKIGITISEAFAARRDGQLLLWMTSNLICRLKGVVSELEIRVPPSVQTSAPRYMPFGSTSPNLRTALSDALGHCARACRVECTSGDDLRPYLDAVVVLGQDAATSSEALFMKSAACSGWLAYVGDKEDLCDLNLPETGNPFGAFAAACIAVGEVYKSVCGMKPDKGDMIDSMCFSAYDLRCRLKPWGNLENPPVDGPVDLGNLHVCGAGAVAHAFCQTLLPMDGLAGNLFFIDQSADPNNPDEKIEPTNLARYIMASNQDEGGDKAGLLADRMSASGIQTGFSDDGFEAYVNRANNVKLPHVVSCVDNNGARHAIQDRIPKMIHGGSTSDLRSQVSVYDLGCNDCQCLKCYNPKKDTASDTEVYERLKNMPMEQRRALAVDRGMEPEVLERHLQDPVCGTLGNESIQKFAEIDDAPEFSVNFVSALTGVLLAGEVVKSKNSRLIPALDGRRRVDASYAFFTNRCHLAPVKPKPACWCSTGKSTPRDVYKQIWPAIPE